MSLYRRSLALLLSLPVLYPALALAAPAAADASTKPPAGPGFDFKSLLNDNIWAIGERILLALLLFIAGWFVAKVIAYGVYRVLCSTSLDNKIAKKLHLGVLLEDSKGNSEPPKAGQLERFLSTIVYYLLMLLVIVGVLEYAGLSQAAGPIQGLVDTIVQALPLVGKAILILTIAYFVGTLLSKLLSRGLKALKVDDRFAKLNGEPDPEAAPTKPFSEHVGSVVFALIMVFGLTAAFEALQISAIAGPLHSALDRLIGVVPSLAFAAIILFCGYVLGRIVRSVLAQVLDSLGLNRLIDRIGIRKIFGSAKPSWVLGTAVMGFIMLQAAIAAFNEMGLVTLSEPLTAMMSRFWLILPSLVVSVAVVAIAVFVGRILRALVAGGLRNLGFDNLLAKLGFAKIAEREDRLGEPSELVGFLVMTGIILLAVAQALANLHLDTWALYVNSFLAYLIKHVVVALVVVLIGLGIGNYVRDVIKARQSADEQQRWLPEFARYIVLILAFTMAIRQLEVAEDFVLLTFGLLFGSLCLAAAIAFGLGSREVAGEIVRKRYNKVQTKPGAKPTAKPTAKPLEGTSAGRSGLFGRPDNK